MCIMEYTLKDKVNIAARRNDDKAISIAQLKFITVQEP